MPCSTEASAALKKRIGKNREKLFTFLHCDGIPWNNNKLSMPSERSPACAILWPAARRRERPTTASCSACSRPFDNEASLPGLPRSGKTEIHGPTRPILAREHVSPAQ